MLESTKLNIRITLIEPLLGTVPKNQNIYSDYIASKAPLAQNRDEEIETVQEDLETKGYTGFHQDENGIFIYDYQVKGFLKEAGNVLKEHVGIKSLKSKLENFVFINPRRIYLGDSPSGTLERPLRIQTPFGERSVLSRSDYVNAGTSFEIALNILPHKEIDSEKILTLLEYGELKGLGQNRNSGYGKFTFEVIE